MRSVKISTKNQIVIPAKYLKSMGLSKGAVLTVYPLDENRIILSKRPKSYAESLRGLGKEVWQKLGGSEGYLQNERNSWDK